MSLLVTSPSYMDDLWYDFSGHIYKYFLGLEIFTNQIDRYFPFFLFEKNLLQRFLSLLMSLGESFFIAAKCYMKGSAFQCIFDQYQWKSQIKLTRKSLYNRGLFSMKIILPRAPSPSKGLIKSASTPLPCEKVFIR